MDRLAWLFYSLGALLTLAGLTLLYWSLLRDRSRGRLRCPKCWYDMAGVAPLACDLATREPRLFRCPECGRAAPTERRLHRTRRRWRWAFASSALFVLAYVSAALPSAGKDPWNIVPTAVFDPLVSLFDADAENAYKRVTLAAASKGATTRWERGLAARHCVHELRKLIAKPRSSGPGRPDVFATLDLLGPEVRLAESTLRKCLTHPSLCAPAAQLLVRMHKPSPDLVSQIIAAAEMCGNGAALGSLIDTLANCGNLARPATPIFSRALTTHPFPEVRMRAASALAEICSRAEAVPPLAAALDDPDVKVAAWAANLLARFGTDSRPATPELSASGTRAPPNLSAIRTLGVIGAESTAYLIPMLGDSRSDVRVAALHALAMIGPGAVAAAPAIAPLLRAADAPTRVAAIDALAMTVIQPGSLLPLLMPAATRDDPEPRNRSLAAAAFESRGADERLSVFTEVLYDPDDALRRYACLQLGRLGPYAASAAPALRSLLVDQPPPVREAAADALRAIGADPAAPAH